MNIYKENRKQQTRSSVLKYRSSCIGGYMWHNCRAGVCIVVLSALGEFFVKVIIYN